MASGFSPYWPINRSLLGTNDFSEAGFRVSEKNLKKSLGLCGMLIVGVKSEHG
jgi:hypothetical protein